ncbi:hypothetical protein A3A21_02650 [Candidatus Jorgensenbacteria bacterium RIFCSPLOWO2_01_FULL_45_25b]|uniref:Type II secretion system protein n=1 Tax=Candidatus Jorgensenbacteria bacterium RIFCSPLOWO2_01_FULL_45_25b TaxID=1798471 RepID=A0A1F6C130_9BACT|nr:MAG: hypothetical protein A3A21_02650 [Candidatus Jorgensenbacteria bacterium RIFCSPLOWO2_01_FULL_45_25b]
MKRKNDGFSLIELLMYIAIFAVSATLLIGILTTVTRVQGRQQSEAVVTKQITFVNQTIQRIVHESSLIDMPSGVASSSLTLRMASSTGDPTRIYVSNGRLYIKEGTKEDVPLTDGNVIVDTFRVKKLESKEGKSLVQVGLGISYNTADPKVKFSRVIEIMVTRITAASFDSDLVPLGSGLSVGNSGNNWQNGYFSGGVGIGIDAPSAGAKLKVAGNIEFSDSSYGLLLKSPNGTCYKLSVSNSGTLSVGGCP